MKPKLEDVLAECGRFRIEFATLTMATVSKEGVPEASYAPYVVDADGAFFIYISELSQHTGNLRDTPKASVLFIENEDQAAHLFARRRLTLRCNCTPVPRSDPRWHQVLDDFKDRFGDLVDVLRELQDFHLFCLQPEAATYVRGFARAYELTGSDLQAIRHINDKGHRSRSQGTDTTLEEADDVG